MTVVKPHSVSEQHSPIESRVAELLSRMTLTEKIGQLSQINGEGDVAIQDVKARVRQGKLGSILNQVNVDIINDIQRVAVEESRLGIPLLIARDVIHGFKTVMPIPLGQAASWNPFIVEQAARAAAIEAASVGINWTFAPMIDISRDPRWGRIAESLGEDPYLTGELGAAMVRGFQGRDLSDPTSIASCVKHFCGYGASEGGRDYSATNIPDNELHNVYLPPFKRCIEEGAATLMASFSDIDGIPATANDYLLKTVLRDQWQFDGLVVSDWNAVQELAVHGIAENDKACAQLASNAGIDMEMSGTSYDGYLETLLDEKQLTIEQIDAMVTHVLRLKFRLGLFERPYTNSSEFPSIANDESMLIAKQAAQESLVLLKNTDRVLPLETNNTQSIAVIGPLADAPYEQLGTWIFDGDESLSVTPLHYLKEKYLKEQYGNACSINYCSALTHSRCKDTSQFDDALTLAKQSDVVVMFLGEESILSGEAHSRADIGLPGAQEQLIKHIKQAGKPIVAVIMAGRSLTLDSIIEDIDALLFAWHPGTMGGPAIIDTLFGESVPSGKLPVSFPKMVGQVPLYYSHKNTGRPATDDSVVLIDDIDQFAEQTSLGMTAFHLDAGYKPLFPFGFGLSYTEFCYQDLHLSSNTLRREDSINVSVTIKNTGNYDGVEVVQLYIRDHVGSVTRPVKELKAFKRIALASGEQKTVSFSISESDLAFYTRQKNWQAEPGRFTVWVGGSSNAECSAEFSFVE